jgi:hypothetical protein
MRMIFVIFKCDLIYTTISRRAEHATLCSTRYRASFSASSVEDSTRCSTWTVISSRRVEISAWPVSSSRVRAHCNAIDPGFLVEAVGVPYF